MTATTDTLRDSPAVRQWHESYQLFWRSGPPPDAALRSLERFVERCEQQPDEIVDEVLRPGPAGEGLMMRTRARRKYMQLIEEFEQHEGSRETANHVRSFMIHNGIAMSPGILR
ncbi:MAG TPA: hypothetical protein QGI71_09385 [Dehalococcoidia bacterium]|jgi:hypothetical protein|nr:hypothetical protein [Dehalococcoidia bacterium]